MLLSLLQSSLLCLSGFDRLDTTKASGVRQAEVRMTSALVSNRLSLSAGAMNPAYGVQAEAQANLGHLHLASQLGWSLGEDASAREDGLASNGRDGWSGGVQLGYAIHATSQRELGFPYSYLDSASGIFLKQEKLRLTIPLAVAWIPVAGWMALAIPSGVRPHYQVDRWDASASRLQGIEYRNDQTQALVFGFKVQAYGKVLGEVHVGAGAAKPEQVLPIGGSVYGGANLLGLYAPQTGAWGAMLQTYAQRTQRTKGFFDRNGIALGYTGMVGLLSPGRIPSSIDPGSRPGWTFLFRASLDFATSLSLLASDEPCEKP